MYNMCTKTPLKRKHGTVMKNPSEVLQLAWSIAATEALAAGHDQIETEHILIGLSSAGKVLPLAVEEMHFSGNQVAHAAVEFDQFKQALARGLTSPDTFRRELRKALGPGKAADKTGKISRSETCKKIFAMAAEVADYKASVTALDFLSAALREPGRALRPALEQMGLQSKQLIDAVETTDAIMPNLAEMLSRNDTRRRYRFPRNSLLGKFGKDLVYMASCGYIYEHVGKGKELARLGMAFERSGSRIPALLGRKDIGKSTIVKALALKIWEGKAPALLADKTIVEFSLDSLEKAAGSTEKAAAMLKAALEMEDGSCVLYLREADKLLAADRKLFGGRLTQALTAKKILFIADAQEESFQKALEHSPALGKLFEAIAMPEPDKPSITELLRCWQPRLEGIHGVRLTETALNAAVDLSFTLSMGEPLPRSAINLLAAACSRAAKNREKPNPAADAELAAIAEKYGLDQSGEVSETLVTALASAKSGISMELVAKHTSGSSPSELFNLESTLEKSIIGQPEAVASATALVKRALGLEPGAPARNKPLAMLFLGPSGVGKTTLALELGRIISAGKEETEIIDLAATGGDRLLDTDGPLRRKLQANPFRTILFKHAECGDPFFYEALAAFLSDRKMSAPDGTVVDIGNAVFILSSSHFSKTAPAKGGNQQKLDKKLHEQIRTFFPLALLEQLDGMPVFRHLDESSCTRLMLAWIDELRVKVREAGSELHVGREVERFLLTQSDTAASGAKKLRMVFDELFASTLDGLLRKGEIARHSDWRVLMADKHVSFVPKTYESHKNEEEPA